MNVDPDLMSLGIRQVLAGLPFPAHRWQVIAQAHYYGAGSSYTVALGQLPARIYYSVAEVAAQLKAPSQQPPRLPRALTPVPLMARHRTPAHPIPGPHMPAHRIPEPRAAVEPALRVRVDS